ncbi:MAG TPA: hypothetical protein VGG16_04795 [Streptosporangiaceae bacterium]
MYTANRTATDAGTATCRECGSETLWPELAPSDVGQLTTGSFAVTRAAEVAEAGLDVPGLVEEVAASAEVDPAGGVDEPVVAADWPQPVTSANDAPAANVAAITQPCRCLCGAGSMCDVLLVRIPL